MVMAQAFSGSISAGGTITSASNTELTATGVATDDSGNITVNGEIASGKEVHASATNGSIRFEGTTTASAGDVTATVSGDGDITFNGAVTAVSEGDAGGNICGDCFRHRQYYDGPRCRIQGGQEYSIHDECRKYYDQ